MPPPDPTQIATHAPTHAPLFHVVLHQPEIPNNTGNIGRTCVATACSLHLIRPLGFDTSEKACRRAGLDYWARLRPVEHNSWSEYRATTGVPDRAIWMFTTKAARPLWSVGFNAGDHLVFGQETRGLPEHLLSQHADRLVTLPMIPHERSLNLATAVCAAVYEALRQQVARGVLGLDEQGRLGGFQQSGG